MAIWSSEIKELEKLNEPISGPLPALEKEMGQLLKTGDEKRGDTLFRKMSRDNRYGSLINEFQDLLSLRALHSSLLNHQKSKTSWALSEILIQRTE